MSEITEIAKRLNDLSGWNDPAEKLYNIREMLVQLLQAVELEAIDFDPGHPEAFEDMLEGLKDRITDRINNHQWN